jgi:hypothetical protein
LGAGAAASALPIGAQTGSWRIPQQSTKVGFILMSADQAEPPLPVRIIEIIE